VQTANLTEKLERLPKSPGVYLFLNNKSKVIYVGKAKYLPTRVKSYFQQDVTLGTKTQRLVASIYDLDYIETRTELDALLLEAELIKRYKPRYNIALKDDKSYVYIVIRNESVAVQARSRPVNIPKILVLRAQEIEKKDTVFGPFPEARVVRNTVRRLRRIFPFRDCSISKFNKYSKMQKPCLYGHIGVCPAPCLHAGGLVAHQKSIVAMKKILSGQSNRLLIEYKNLMQKASSEQRFEEAIEYRNTVSRLEYVSKNPSSATDYIQNPTLAEDSRQLALKSIALNIPLLNSPPVRIECYDISNISGKNAVGSMVVAIDGRIDKSEYRKFKIQTKTTPDDFYMMSEVLYRRLKREISTQASSTKWGMPDLIVLDGGKGQVSAVLEVFTKLNIDIPLIGIAKKFETLVYFKDGKFNELSLQKDDEGLKLIQQLRDEAHRFAQSYFHKLRLKELKS